MMKKSGLPSPLNMGYGHMLDVRKLTEMQGDPDSWLDEIPSAAAEQKAYYQSCQHGYARGYEAYRYVEGCVVTSSVYRLSRIYIRKSCCYSSRRRNGRDS